jgi:predicted nuclease of predicted toxin-antitoxin system
VGTLASELWHVAEGLAQAPRVYCDANLPIGLIRFMRQRLRWDVFFVLEEDDLRRAADVEHFRMAAQLRRTLLTLDRDYLDDARFPPEHGAGVLVLSAADEAQFERLLTKVDRMLFKSNAGSTGAHAEVGRLPLLGRKLHLQIDWSGELEPT